MQSQMPGAGQPPTGVPMQPPPMYPGQQPMYPGQQPMYPPPPAPRARGRMVAIVAVIVVVAVVVLAAVLYFLVFSQTKPTITLSSPMGTGSGFLINVTSVSQAYSASSYRVGLLTNVSAGGTGALSLYTTITVSGDVYIVAWGDMNVDGKLTAGDAFIVASTGGLPGGVTFTFRILWSDGSVITSVNYVSAATAPSVYFNSATAVTDGFGFSVSYASHAEPASDFKVNLLVNSSAATSVPLASTMSFTVGGNTYTGTWTDAAGEGTLTGGDSFTITLAGGLPSSTDFEFLLLWSADGTEIASSYYVN